ncbi:MAG: Na+/H+ antiporter [Pseudoxanthomonas sp.]
MHSIEVVLAMLLAVAGSGYLARMLPAALPLPLVQIVLGAVIAAVSGDPVQLDPQLFFVLLLPPLLFLDGWRIPKEGLFRDRAVILELALGLVVFTVVGMGFFIHWLIPSIPLPVAFALAAIVSPTDPVAVSSIASKAPIPKRMMHILEGESLLNDASGLVCFRFAVAAAISGGFSLTAAALNFVWVALAGLAVGTGLTWVVSLAQRTLSRKLGEESGTPILVNLLIPFGAYLLAEHIHASGILAAVAAGISMSYVELSGRTLATTRVQRTAVWDTVQFAINGIMFVLLGEQLPGILRSAVATVQQSGHVNPWWLLVYALAISSGLVALRFVWVWVSLRWGLLIGRHEERVPKRVGWRLIAATSVAGVRGAITLAGVMTLPLTLDSGAAFPARDLAIFLAMTVILVSLIGASLALPRLLRGLEVPPEPEYRREEDMARQAAAAAAIAAIQAEHDHLSRNNVADADLYAAAATRAMQAYQRRLDNASEGIDAEQLRKADAAELSLRLAGLRAERERIFELARHRRVSDQTSRRLVRELDLLEERLSTSA